MHLPQGNFSSADLTLPPGETSSQASAEMSVQAVARSAPIMPRRMLPVVRVMDLEIHAVTEQEAIAFVLEELAAGRGGTTITPNLDHLRRYMRDVMFKNLVAEADLVVPDGMPLLWAAKVKGTPLPQRVAGSDLILSMSKAAASAGRTIYLLGGAAGTAEGAADVLRQKYPDIKIVGYYCPPMGFENSPPEMAKMLSHLEAAKPDIIYVALGSPKQEMLIDRIRSHLPRAWWVGVGVSFSFLTGHVKRAPRWIQKLGIEWVHRMFQEPGRLVKRYLMEGIPFGCMMMADAVWQRTLRTTGMNVGTVGRSSRRPMHTFGSIGALGGASGGMSGGMSGDLSGIASSAANSERSRAGDQLAAAHVPEYAASVAFDEFGYQLLDEQSELAGTGAASNRIDPDSLSGGGQFEIANKIKQPAWAGPMRLVRDADSASPIAALPRLRSMVLLGGQVRASQFAQSIGRSVLDLPVNENNDSLLNHWLGAIRDLAKFANLENLPAQLLLSAGQERPTSQTHVDRVNLIISDDKAAYRGTAGVLRDLCKNYDDNDWVLVANAGQLLMEPLSVLAAALAHKRADVALINHIDGTPSGLMLVRCAALRVIKPIGYVDMKEQGLAQIARQFEVRVLHCRRPTGLSIRSATDYIAALRQFARGGRRDRRHAVDPLAEDFTRSFAIIEPGAGVDPDAYIHDAVILKGARVESAAAVVRSIIAPGTDGVVRRGWRVVDQVAAQGDQSLTGRGNVAKKATENVVGKVA